MVEIAVTAIAGGLAIGFVAGHAVARWQMKRRADAMVRTFQGFADGIDSETMTTNARPEEEPTAEEITVAIQSLEGARPAEAVDVPRGFLDFYSGRRPEQR